MIRESQISVVFLAAGLSRRMGGPNKLLLSIPGQTGLPLALASAQALSAVPFLEKVAVLGRDDDTLRCLLADQGFRFVRNADYAAGQGGSVACGTAALSPDSQAAFYVMADQPGLSPEVFRRLAEAFQEQQILRPRYGGTPGSPVLFDRCYYPELSELSGELGGSALFARHPETVAWLDLPASLAAPDLDRPEDFLPGKELPHV